MEAYREGQEEGTLDFMILWLTGNSGAGKTTAAHTIWAYTQNAVWLDGDRMRKVWPGLGFSGKDRWEQNLRIARLVKLLHDDQDLNVVVSSICPYRDLRDRVREIIPEVQFVFLSGGKEPSEEYPYEDRQSDELHVEQRE